ncbi:hypothetical protein HBI40_160940 [Parastagonospora nodorum]|nr:hypothetical protein HBH46_210560 [Parastagonospora nodorum]KAH5045982.1 hypothetical protein HBH96_240150 [Parastagonospora nodorum]KAH5168813.1 hypothetical protein HBH68_225850 [Parastagonospora nodorum]KAH5179211.1 hypothetical protein HBH76_182420 [Parastagonospora nodorum]KAH5240233.1 hypothetical protein HBI71_219350 [Parastagonospora nodorum]
MVVASGLMYFVYSDIAAAWVQLYSRTISSVLLTMTRMNAPINYVGPLEWVYTTCKKWSMPTMKILPSICIGTVRVTYVVEYMPTKCIMKYRQHPNVVKPMDPNDAWNSACNGPSQPTLRPPPG